MTDKYEWAGHYEPGDYNGYVIMRYGAEMDPQTVIEWLYELDLLRDKHKESDDNFPYD